MRITIDIDDDLMAAAMEATGLKTKKAVVEEALRRMVKYPQQVAALQALEGSADWEGDLKAMRKDRHLGKL
jgi:Arc/MetJ family transcription regulator